MPKRFLPYARPARRARSSTEDIAAAVTRSGLWLVILCGIGFFLVGMIRSVVASWGIAVIVGALLLMCLWAIVSTVIDLVRGLRDPGTLEDGVGESADDGAEDQN